MMENQSCKDNKDFTMNSSKGKLKGKKEYCPPIIEVLMVKMEQGIAASSAAVIPVNSNDQVQEEWTTDGDVTGDQDW